MGSHLRRKKEGEENMHLVSPVGQALGWIFYVYYFFNPHHFMVLLSFHFIDEETEDEVTCPRKLQTHALALWLSCQKCQDPEGELPNSAARGSLPSPHLKS